MLLGILLMILTLYGLLLFWILNEKLREMHYLLREIQEKLEKVEKNLSHLLESGYEGGEREPEIDRRAFFFSPFTTREGKRERRISMNWRKGLIPL